MRGLCQELRKDCLGDPLSNFGAAKGVTLDPLRFTSSTFSIFYKLWTVKLRARFGAIAALADRAATLTPRAWRHVATASPSRLFRQFELGKVSSSQWSRQCLRIAKRETPRCLLGNRTKASPSPVVVRERQNQVERHDNRASDTGHGCIALSAN